MGEEVEKLSGKLGIDTTDFKTAIGAANREIRVLESSFKATAASLQDWTKDATGLESRMKTLTSQIDIQKLKVSALQAEHQRLVEANGANSRAAQDAEIKLNKETETLNKMTSELGTTEQKLAALTSEENAAGNAAQEMGDDIDKSGSKVETFKSVVSGGVTMLKGFATGVLAVGAAAVSTVALLGGMVFTTANVAAGIVDLSAKTGIGVEQLQEMAYIGEQVGTSLDTITGAQAKLVRSMASGRDGTGEQAKAFKALGVDIEDAAGNLRSTQDVFGDVIDKLGAIENPAERDALAMTLFGKSAQELNPLIAAGSDELARMADEAHNVGAVMAEEDVAAFEAFDDTLASLQAGFKGTVGTLLTAFLPTFQSVFDQAGGYLQQFKDIVNASDGDLGKVAEGLTGLITQIAQDIAKQAPQMLEAGLSIVQSILDAVTSALPSMLDAAIAILTSLINFIVANLPALISAGVQILLVLVNAIVANLPMLVNAALQAVIALANGLAAALPELIPAIVQAVITIVQTLIDNIPLLVDAASALLIGLAQGLIVALPILIAAIPQLIDALVNALLQAYPLIFSTAGQLIGTLAYGILANLPLIVAGAAQIVVTILQTLAKLPKAAWDNGKAFIQGLLDGINSAKSALFNAITNMANEMISSVEEALGIASPSKEGRRISRNFWSSHILGGMDVIGDVQRSFAAMAGSLATSAASGLAGGGVNQSTTNSVDVFGNVIIAGQTTAGSLAEDLTKPRY